MLSIRRSQLICGIRNKSGKLMEKGNRNTSLAWSARMTLVHGKCHHVNPTFGAAVKDGGLTVLCILYSVECDLFQGYKCLSRAQSDP